MLFQTLICSNVAIRELIRQNRNLIEADPSQDICEFIGLQVPSPATMKFVGAATLRALGYPSSGDKQGPAIWDEVKIQLKLRQTCFLHLDEAHDLARYQTDKERQSVVNTLKSLMENSYWPTGLILSGMPDLKKIVNQDPQLARRLYPHDSTALVPAGALLACCGPRKMKRTCKRQVLTVVMIGALIGAGILILFLIHLSGQEIIGPSGLPLFS